MEVEEVTTQEAVMNGDEALLVQANGVSAAVNDEELVWSDDEDQNGEENMETNDIPPAKQMKMPANELEAKNNGHIKVVSILGPYEFSVITKEGEQKLKELDHYIKKHCRYHEPCKQEDLKVGKYVLAYSKTYKTWCRAEIVFLHQSKNHDLKNDLFCDNLGCESVTAHLIDYRFNEDEIPIKHIRLGDKFFEFTVWPVRAVKCALAGFKTDPKKTFESTELMKSLLYDRYVWFLFQTIKSGVTFIAISYQLKGVSVEHVGLKESLISSGMGTIDTTTDLYRINYKFGKSYKEPTLPKVNDVFTGVISHTESPDRFFINRASDKDTILKQQEEINKFFGDAERAQHFKMRHFMNGIACIAKYSVDDRFYRAIVEVINDLGKKCAVRYVDYGNNGEVKFEDIYLLPDQFLVEPKMCIECRLAGVEPVNHKWSQNFILRFRELLGDCASSTDNQHLAVQVQYRERGCVDPKIPVSIKRWEPNQVTIDIAEMMIQSGAATPVHAPPDRALLDIMRESVSSVSIIKDICERHEMAKASLRGRLIPIAVTFAEGPDEIWVQNRMPNVKQIFLKFFQELQRKMSEAMAVKQEKFDLQVDRLCAFRVPAPDGTYFVRGKIIEKMDVDAEGFDIFKVRAIDYGALYRVSRNKIFELPSQFVTHDPYAVQCSLFGIKSSIGDEWTATSKNKVGEFMADDRWKDRIYLLVKEKIKFCNPDAVIKCNIVGEEIKVQLYETEPVYHSLCDMMTDEYGVAMPINRSADYVTDKDILNDKTPIHSTEVSHRGVPDVQLDRDSLYSRIMQATINSDEPCRYRDPILPDRKTFEGQVTDVDGKFRISFRLIENNPTIKAINRDISSEMVNGGLCAFNPPHEQGRACTARFSQDKTWNRAKFLGFRHGNIADVLFIDYGNTDQLFLENLSSKVFAPSTPALAIKSQLYGARPAKNEILPLLLKEMYEELVDKVCLITWENHPNVPMKVSMVIKESRRDIKKYLVNKDLMIEIIEAQELPPSLLKVLSTIPRSIFNESLYNQVDKKCFIPVCVSATFAHNVIYLQLCGIQNPVDEQNDMLKQATDRFLAMQEQLQSFAPTQRTVSSSIGVGDPCLAKYPVDKDYYRALVLEVAEDFSSDLIVYFVDYGNICKVSSFDVRELSPNYCIDPPPVQGIPVRIENIRPKLGRWTPELEKKVENYLAEQSNLIAKFSEVNLDAGHSRNSPKTICSVELFLATTENPLVPARRAFEPLVASGDLEIIDASEPLLSSCDL